MALNIDSWIYLDFKEQKNNHTENIKKYASGFRSKYVLMVLSSMVLTPPPDKAWYTDIRIYMMVRSFCR